MKIEAVLAFSLILQAISSCDGLRASYNTFSAMLSSSSKPTKAQTSLTALGAENHLESFSSQESYLSHLRSISQLPKGFKVGATRFSFRPFEVEKTLPMNITVIQTEKATKSFAAMFTSNRFPGGPIYVGRNRLRESKELQAIVVNNKISNVCPGGVSDGGQADSESICEAVSKEFGLGDSGLVFPSSTGIIGWRLPVQQMKEALPEVLASMQSESILPAAMGITTTDRYPKVRSYVSKDGRWRIVGTVKGAGMIEPNMATMLCYILTDLDLPRDVLQRCLQSSVGASFNAISVDGDQSTSDTVLLVSSGAVDVSVGADDGAADRVLEEFSAALTSVCGSLSEDVVRNGEGTQHVIKVTVTGAPTFNIARDMGRFVVNSNLVKCAIAGCDPNVGRIVGAIGSYLGKLRVSLPEVADSLSDALEVTLGGTVIFSQGSFQLDPTKEKVLSDYMLEAQLFPAEVPEEERNYPPHNRCVEIGISLNGRIGQSRCIVIGSDLTKEYVEVNADYRS